LHGSPYVGVNGVAGEFGHLVVQPTGPLCNCGLHGCIEALASASAVAKRYQELTQAQELVSARDVAERAAAGDEAATKIWGEAIEALSLGIANYVTLLDPERVILGGGMADAGATLFDPLNARLCQLVRFQPVPAVVPAELGNDAGYLGAALKAWLAVGVPLQELNWRGDR
jgi:glucokinase